MPATWAPTTEAVGALLPARLLNTDGQAKSFTDTTTPTKGQVAEIVDQASGDIVAAVGSFDPATVINPADVERGQEPVTLGELARTAAALDAASMVELTFFADHVGDNSSAYPQLYERYKAALARLVAAIEALKRGGITTGSSTPVPTFRFPPAVDRSRTSF